MTHVNKMLYNMLLGLPDLPYFTGAPVFETVSPVSRLIPIRETLSPVFQCLKYGWTVMDGVQALIFKAGRRPATSWANAAWTASRRYPGGKFHLRKISKIGATRCQILRLKCTKFNFRWGSCPIPHWGAYSAPPDPLAVFKGPTSKGREVE